MRTEQPVVSGEVYFRDDFALEKVVNMAILFCFVLLISLMCIANAKAYYYDGFAHFIHNIYSILSYFD